MRKGTKTSTTEDLEPCLRDLEIKSLCPRQNAEIVETYINAPLLVVLEVVLEGRS